MSYLSNDDLVSEYAGKTIFRIEDLALLYEAIAMNLLLVQKEQREGINTDVIFEYIMNHEFVIGGIETPNSFANRVFVYFHAFEKIILESK